MNILLISSFIYLTIQQQCQEIGVSQCNSQLRAGLLPTYLFNQVFSLKQLPLFNQFSPPITIQQGWTLTPNHFKVEALIENQTYTGNQFDENVGQITVSNATLLVEVGFLFQNGTIQNGQGIAFLENVQSANYTFNITTKSNSFSYEFSYVDSYINFDDSGFRAIYVNFPYEIGQIQEIISALNSTKTIQKALTQFYSNTSPNSLSAQIIDQLNSFETIKNTTFTKVYRNGISFSAQKFSYNVTIKNAQITYSPVSYSISAQMNIESLKTGYNCKYPIITLCTITDNKTNVEQVSMDEIINSFNYAFQQNYFNTILLPSSWKVPFFSWTTGGLNNIMTPVYTQYAYMSSISGLCNTNNQTAQYINASSTYFTVAMSFYCQLSVSSNLILNFTVAFEEIQVELDFSRVKEQASFKVKSVSTPNIQFLYTQNISNQELIEWYIQEAINNSFVGKNFFSGFFETQRDLESQEITYTISSEGIITIIDKKK